MIGDFSPLGIRCKYPHRIPIFTANILLNYWSSEDSTKHVKNAYIYGFFADFFHHKAYVT
jgi:hypothetical protein